MVETQEHFAQRLDALGRKHRKMTHGYVTKVTKDGLIVVHPKKASRFGGGAALKVLVLGLAGFIAFKAVTLAVVGPITYNERLAKLEGGTILEQVGAKALAIDPVTEVVGGTLSTFIK